MNENNRENGDAPVADFYMPEGGAGESDATFSASAQREQFLGGASAERESASPTDASDSLLGRFFDRVDVSMATMAVATTPVWGGIAAFSAATGDIRATIVSAFIGAGAAALGLNKLNEIDTAKASQPVPDTGGADR